MLQNQNLSEIKNKYSQLSENKLPENTQNDLNLINKLTSQRYQMPVVTKNCQYHPTVCYEFQDALKTLNENKPFKCQQCTVEVTQTHELVKDIRWQAYTEFNELTTDISIVSGMMFNKFEKKYQRLNEIMKQQSFYAQLKDIDNRFSQQNSVNKLIVNQISVSQSQRQRNQKAFYWAFCLLDKIKITIPIRILNCNHIECYDLSSLLSYYKETLDKTNLYFQCRMPGCQNKLKMATLSELFAGIVLDKDLLKVIKKCNPSLYKFYFNIQTLSLDEEAQVINQKKVDFAISQYYQKVLKKELNDQYFEFQEQVQRKVVQVITSDSEGKDNLLKYKTYEISMKDPITDINIEYPARCKNCKDLTKYVDLRIFIASFFSFQVENPNQKFKCMLCGNAFDKASIQIRLLQNYVCIEGNLLFHITKDMSYIGTGKFLYEGEKYMLQEFMERQKYPIAEYKKNLLETNKSLEVNYENLFCASQIDQPLEFPLLLKKCQYLKIIDFKTFYAQLKNNNFDLSKGIKFCSCNNCQLNLIKDITGNIYFHEGIYEMLQILKQNKVQPEQQKLITFNFEKMIQVISNYFGPSDKDANQKMKGQEGFTNLMDDEVYQKIFSRNKIEKWDFKINSIDQSVCDGVYVVHNQNGVTGNLEQKRTQMNEYAEQSGLNKWGFKVVQLSVQLNDELFSTNRGTINSTEFK